MGAKKHWIRYDGRGWRIPHGRITLNQGTLLTTSVTCRVCLRLIAEEREAQRPKEPG